VESKTEAKIKMRYPSREVIEKISKILAGPRAGKFWHSMNYQEVLATFFRGVLTTPDPEAVSVMIGRVLAIFPNHIREKIERRAEEYRMKLTAVDDEDEENHDDYLPVFDDEEDYVEEQYNKEIQDLELENQIWIRAITDICYELNLIPQEYRPPIIDYADFRKIFEKEEEEYVQHI